MESGVTDALLGAGGTLWQIKQEMVLYRTDRQIFITGNSVYSFLYRIISTFYRCCLFIIDNLTVVYKKIAGTFRDESQQLVDISF